MDARMNRRLDAVAVLASSVMLVAMGCGSGSSSSRHASTTASAKPASGEVKGVSVPRYASPSPSEPVRSGVVRIAYRNIAIDPDTVRIKAGGTVEWTNEDPEKCNVTSEGGPYKFASGDLGEGATFELKLTRAGTIHYECTYYPATMNGTIEVAG
jgi:plastocyanin